MILLQHWTNNLQQIGQLDLSDFDVIDHGILSQRLTVSYGFRDSGLNHSYTGGSVSPLDLSSQTLVCFLLVLVYSFQNQTTKKLDRLFLSTRRALSI